MTQEKHPLAFDGKNPVHVIGIVAVVILVFLLVASWTGLI